MEAGTQAREVVLLTNTQERRNSGPGEPGSTGRGREGRSGRNTNSLDQVVEVKVNDEFKEEDIIEVFNKNGSVEWETEYEYNSDYVLITNE